MTNLPIAASAPTPTTVKRAQAKALQQNSALPGAVQADENSFHDALLQMLGKGLGNAFSAAGTAAVAGSKADSTRKTDAQTEPAPDAPAQPDALALPQWFASALAPAATRPVGLSTVLASAKAALDPQTGADTTPVLDANALTDALALPLPQVLASALIPAAGGQAGFNTVVGQLESSL